jgi:hypothetical protein
MSVVGTGQREGPNRLGLVIVGLAVLAACSYRGSVAAEPVIVPATTSTTVLSSPSKTSTTSATQPETVVSTPDLSVLIATIEAAMKGTSYEGTALEEPEVFIATAQLFCELLDQGLTVDEVLGEYLDRLSEGGAAAATDQEVRLAGVLLGVAIEVLCPEHRDAV